MTISEVGKKYDISPDTLRYYEKAGLLRNVPRTPSGLRDYDEASCRTIEFVKCMRSAGVSIETLCEYIELFHMGDSTTEMRKKLLIEQREKIKSKIAELESALQKLDYKIEHYESISFAQKEILTHKK